MYIDFDAIKNFADAMNKAHHADTKGYAEGRYVYSITVEQSMFDHNTVKMHVQWPTFARLVEEADASCGLVISDLANTDTLHVSATLHGIVMSACINNYEAREMLRKAVGCTKVDTTMNMFKAWQSATGWGLFTDATNAI